MLLLDFGMESASAPLVVAPNETPPCGVGDVATRGLGDPPKPPNVGGKDPGTEDDVVAPKPSNGEDVATEDDVPTPKPPNREGPVVEDDIAVPKLPNAEDDVAPKPPNLC